VKLFDLQTDIAEKADVAGEHPDIAAKVGDYLKRARSESAEWQPVWSREKK
jgi:hypothetical protein